MKFSQLWSCKTASGASFIRQKPSDESLIAEYNLYKLDSIHLSMTRLAQFYTIGTVLNLLFLILDFNVERVVRAVSMTLIIFVAYFFILMQFKCKSSIVFMAPCVMLS